MNFLYQDLFRLTLTSLPPDFSFEKRIEKVVFSYLQLPKELKKTKNKEQTCRKVFSKDDPVYRCRDCSTDDTCVLCSECFFASNHHGHQTGFHLAGTGGGCCDCGDQEAWKCDIQCKKHPRDLQNSKDSFNLDDLPQDFLLSLKSTVATVFDFIIDTLQDAPFARSPPKNILELKEMLRVECANQGDVCCVLLWNDEVHSFQEVISQVIDATGCSTVDARLAAETVDSYGRFVISESSDLNRLLQVALKIDEIKLMATVRTRAETTREYIVGFLIDLMKDLGSRLSIFGNLNSSLFSYACSHLICTALFEKHFNQKDALLKRSVIKTKEEIEIEKIEREEWPMLFNDQSEFVRLRIDHLLCFDSKLWSKARRDFKELCVSNLLSDWNGGYKKQFAYRFAFNYLRLCNLMINIDKEDEFTAIEFDVQLFTVPSIAESLLLNTQIFSTTTTLLRSLYLVDIFPTQFSHDKLFASYSLAKITPPRNTLKLSSEGESLKNKRIWRISNSLRYLIASKKVKETVFIVNQHSIDRVSRDINSFLDIIFVWQGMSPQSRQTRNHVEYETELWINSFNVTLHTMTFRSRFAECFAPLGIDPLSDLRTLSTVLSIAISRIDMWCADEQYLAASYMGPETDRKKLYRNIGFIEGKENLILSYQLSSNPVSFHHPAHWFLSHLMTYIPLVSKFVNNQSIWEVVFLFANNEDVDMKIEDRVLRLIEPSIRVNALISQIKCGFWVRNGFSIRSQAIHYKEASLRDCLDYDILLLQVGTVFVDSDKFLLTLIDRFELLEWLSGITQTKKVESMPFLTLDTTLSMDLNQFATLAEEFLYLLTTVLTERSRVVGRSYKDELFIEVVHHLATNVNGLVYSELYKRISNRLQDPLDSANSELWISDSLKICANFKAPDGAADQGLYELKAEYYDHVDPWFWHYTRNQKEEVEQVLNKKKKPIVQSPLYEFADHNLKLPIISELPNDCGFVGLDSLVVSKTFVKILYVSLWNVSRSPLPDASLFTPIRNDSIFSTCLHLIIVSFQISTRQKFLDIVVGVKFKVIKGPFSTLNDVNVGATLLELLLNLLERSDETFISDFISLLKCILHNIELSGCGVSVFNEWKAKMRQLDNSDVTSDADFAKKKLEAKSRKSRLMDQFVSQQKQFISNFEDDLGEMETDKPFVQQIKEQIWNFPNGTCIVCQEEANNEGALYGMLGFVQPCYLQKHLNFGNPFDVIEVTSTPMSLDMKFSDNNSLLDRRAVAGCSPGLLSSTCGHLMHFACFKSYTASLEARHHTQPTRNHPENINQKEFMCPLCKSLGNSLFPILWNEKVEILNWVNGISEVANNISNNEFGQWLNRNLETFKSFSKKDNTEFPNAKNTLLMSNFVDVLKTNSGSESFDFFLNNVPNANSASMLLPYIRDIKTFNSRMEAVLCLVYRHIDPDFEFEENETGNGVLELLVDTITHTISALEVQCRGLQGKSFDKLSKIDQNQYGLLYMGVLDSCSHQNLALLRVLSETALTCLMMFKGEQFDVTLTKKTNLMVNSIFYGFLQANIACDDCCLLKDPFMLFVDFAILVLPEMNMQSLDDILHFNYIFWIMEIVRSASGLIEGIARKPSSFSFTASKRKESQMDLPSEDEASEFFLWIMDQMKMDNESKSVVLKTVAPLELLLLCTTTSLPFLRRSILLLYSRFGVVSPGTSTAVISDIHKFDSGKALETEFVRLSRFLKFPRISELFSRKTTQDPILSTFISGWFTHLLVGGADSLPIAFKLSTSPMIDVSLPSTANTDEPMIEAAMYDAMEVDFDQCFLIFNPSIPNLIKLPERFDLLFEESRNHVCKRCGNIPASPALCLLCGTFVCNQSFCCQEDEEGECNIHTRECGGDVGAFLLIKKCIILLIHNKNGCFMNPPYLDSHGETDVGLRHGRPLYLNHKRYDELRRLWLTHSMPSFVARKIEQSFDFGGWITM